ncbi:tetratricopeptide repeat protein [Reichenbachiella agarivorans]|uniref:Tetratricopeptide repeat protein n=1 Tax=Reichenbachiella agarivorans TaxID=2979464 RepID=A0ABY6CJ75_9BACT|nr:tetratricopeptide repeat-containing sensor histidine kinase [Reichenbachiella agarivorans]UXP30577.1 tetratricopeptide repeat protein [Reichenbachiella agarivorans]
MPYHRSFLILLILSFSIAAHSEPTINKDSLTIRSLQSLAWSLKFSEPRKAMQALDSAERLSTQLSSVQLTADVLYYKAMIYYLLSEYPDAITLSQQALTQYQSIDNHYGQASIYNLLGLINQRIGSFEAAIQSYHLSLDQAKYSDNLYAISNPQHNIALVYLDMQEYEKSLEYALKAKEIRIEIADSSFIAQSDQTIGGLYYHLQRYPEAIQVLERSILVFQAQEDWNSLSISFSNLGLVMEDIHQYDKAREYYQEAARFSRLVEDHESLVNTLVNLANLSSQQNKLMEALDYATEARELSTQHQLLPSLKDALESLQIIQEKQGKLALSLSTLKAYNHIADSLLNQTKAKQIANLEIQFQVKEKESTIRLQKQEIELQTAQNEQKTILITALGLLSILLVILAYFIRSSLIKKQKILATAADLRIKKASLAASIQSQEKERSRFAKDLHDNLGQLISVVNLSIGKLQAQPDLLPNERDESYALCSDTLSDMYKELKNVCFDLMPQSLQSAGLVAAIRELTDRINAVGKTQIELITDGSETYPSGDFSISVYRICQEWLNNILKYADATEVTIQIIQDEDESLLMIEDNGMGFDASQLLLGHGYGWKNMSARASLIGGDIDLDTRPNRKGNTFTLCIPKNTLEPVNNP